MKYVGEGTAVRDTIWAEVTLCLGKLCKCWKRKFWVCCIFHHLHTQTLQRAGWSLRGVNMNVCMFWVTQGSTSTLLRATEDSRPVSSIWIGKRRAATWWGFVFLFCCFHADSTAVLAISLLLTGIERSSESLSYTSWRDSLHHQWHKPIYSDNLPFSSPKAYCPPTLLLSVPFQREQWLPAE